MTKKARQLYSFTVKYLLEYKKGRREEERKVPLIFHYKIDFYYFLCKFEDEDEDEGEGKYEVRVNVR